MLLLDALKSWYTLEEAAARLSRKLSEPIGERDVIQLAADGHLSASWFLRAEHNRHGQPVTISCDYPRGERVIFRSWEIPEKDGRIYGSRLTGIFKMPVDLSPAWGWWLLTFLGHGGESGNWCGDFLIDSDDGACWELYVAPHNGEFCEFPAKCDVVITRKDIEEFEGRIVGLANAEAVHPAGSAEPIRASGEGDNVDQERSKCKPPMSRTAAQDAAIISELQIAGFDPLKLPKPMAGTAGVKAEIRRRLLERPDIFISKKVFETAWQRLRDEGAIKDA